MLENIIVKDLFFIYNNCDIEKQKIRFVVYIINGIVEKKKFVKDFFIVLNN